MSKMLFLLLFWRTNYYYYQTHVKTFSVDKQTLMLPMELIPQVTLDVFWEPVDCDNLQQSPEARSKMSN